MIEHPVIGKGSLCHYNYAYIFHQSLLYWLVFRVIYPKFLSYSPQLCLPTWSFKSLEGQKHSWRYHFSVHLHQKLDFQLSQNSLCTHVRDKFSSCNAVRSLTSAEGSSFSRASFVISKINHKVWGVQQCVASRPSQPLVSAKDLTKYWLRKLKNNFPKMVMF